MPELKIEKLVYGGDGMGFLEGKVCFVEGALPGEKVAVEIFQDKKNFSRGRLVSILEPSPARRAPECPYVASCGGCQYQHLAYEEELRWKENQVRDYFARELKTDPGRVKAIRHAAKPYGYRNSVTLHAARGGVPGFFGRDNESVVPVAECLIADPALAPVFSRSIPQGEKNLSFRLSGAGEILSSADDRLFQVSLLGESFWTHSRSFFQNNLAVTEQLLTQARAWVDEAGPDTFMDLYAGSGLFALMAAPGVKSLVCAEENPYSLQALEKNLEGRPASVVLAEGRVESFLHELWEKEAKGKTFVFLDPPRQGLAPEAADFFAHDFDGEALVYLSCHMGTLLRDLKKFQANPAYELKEVVPFDMFPRTKHIEVAAFFRRRKES
ncbi:MAG TPA: TRAM domain-containing protein [Verrucomicrobiae bacterium]|nr:TRAM domain-containing protein [Verrucomicrobiae bacterium]